MNGMVDENQAPWDELLLQSGLLWLVIMFNVTKDIFVTCWERTAIIRIQNFATEVPQLLLFNGLIDM